MCTSRYDAVVARADFTKEHKGSAESLFVSLGGGFGGTFYT